MTKSSRWRRWCVDQLLRLGPWRGNLLLSGVSVLLALGIGAGVAATAGRGGADLWLAAAAAGVACALVAPWFNLVLLRVWFAMSADERHAVPAAVVDELTGVHTRRHFMALAERELARCRRYQTPAALLLVDADHFKRLNDQHGRACGDALLRDMTRTTQELLRQADLLGRFGGEELIVFLPHTDPLGALDVADRIRDRISALQMPWRDTHVHVTVSIGVAPLEPVHTTLDSLLQDADSALFAAKEAGRNCVRATPIQPRRNGEHRRIPARK